MTKIKKLFLFIFLTVMLKPIYTHCGGDRYEYNGYIDLSKKRCQRFWVISEKLNNEIELKKQLVKALKTDFEKAKAILKQNILDLNFTPFYFETNTLFGLVIHNALHYSSSIPHALEIVEYFLQHGADVNAISTCNHATEYAPLGQVIVAYPQDLNSYLKLIELLVGYGANISDEILELAKKSEMSRDKASSEKVLEILNHHQKLVNEALIGPTRELLVSCIASNKPYIVKIILQHHPEFALEDDLKSIQEICPAAIFSLLKALRAMKFRELAEKRCLPIELVKYIEKFVEYS